MQIDTLFERAKLPDGTARLHRGRERPDRGHRAAMPRRRRPRRSTSTLPARLLVPGFVEGHIHLDTSFIGDNWKPHRPCTNGFDVRERVQFQKPEPGDRRRRCEIGRAPRSSSASSHGTTQMRSHVDVDAAVGMAPSRDHHGGARGLPRRRRHPARRVSAERRDLVSRHAPSCSMPRSRAGCDLIGGHRSGDHRSRRRGAARRGVRHRRAARRRRRHPPARSAHARRVPDRADRRAHARARACRAMSRSATPTRSARCRSTSRAAPPETLAEGGVAIMTNAPGSYPFPPDHGARQGRRHGVQRQRQHPRLLVALRRRRHAGARHDHRLPLGLLHRRGARACLRGRHGRTAPRHCGSRATASRSAPRRTSSCWRFSTSRRRW